MRDYLGLGLGLGKSTKLYRFCSRTLTLNGCDEMMKAIIVDLNNFSRYPTLSVGYLSSILRRKGVDVKVLSPLFFGVHGFPRRVREYKGAHVAKMINHIGATSTSVSVKKIHNYVKKIVSPSSGKSGKVIVDSFQKMLADKPDIVLVSAYTMYLDVCSELAKICLSHNIPLLVGGNSFGVPEIARKWNNLPGVSGVFAGEPESYLMDILVDLIAGSSITGYSGVYSDDKSSYMAPPLKDLNSIPFPDFSDFPWDSYPNRIIPIMTGRGCEWGLCDFCSDVTTSAGRTYRSRSLDNVLDEVAYQKNKHNADLFVFLDLKLNSDLEVWRGLSKHLPLVAPDIRWTASVHVDSRDDNGLGPDDLQRAANAGLARITCGLESGSQKILNRMGKGVRLKRLSDFVKTAHALDISVRLTSIIGHPYEDVEDIDLTVKFLSEHQHQIERIVVNRLAFQPFTPLSKAFESEEKKMDHITLLALDEDSAIIPHINKKYTKMNHILAVYRLLRVANKINNKPLIERARDFEGAF